MTPSNARLRVAVAGAGQFGKNHIRVCSQNPRVHMAAIVDPDPQKLAAAEVPEGCLRLSDARELAGLVDAAVVSAPTSVHESVGVTLLEAGIDVLVEKPIAPTLEAADHLIAAAGANRRILQVGHLERFNPVILALEQAVTLPLFFEVHRMSVFSPRSLDVDVVLDLMIHDLDVVLSLARGTLQDVRAAGVSVLSRKVDIANVRLEFDDGCVANLTASRVSTERIRKLRLFQPQQYISLDYAKQEAAEYTVQEGGQIGFRLLPSVKDEPLKLQFNAFLDSVETRSRPKLNGRVARRTLKVALEILAKIEQHAGLIERTIAKAMPGHPLSRECQP